MIVVAIIAVLVAIMIPVFSNSRASAIEAKDAANVRAAYAEAVMNAMSASDYDATTGNLQVAFTVPTAKGPGTTVKYDSTNHVITVKNTGTSGEGIKIDVDDKVTFTGTPGFDP